MNIYILCSNATTNNIYTTVTLHIQNADCCTDRRSSSTAITNSNLRISRCVSLNISLRISFNSRSSHINLYALSVSLAAAAGSSTALQPIGSQAAAHRQGNIIAVSILRCRSIAKHVLLPESAKCVNSILLIAGYYIILVSDSLISLLISAADINLIAVAHNLLLISLFALAVEAVSSINAIFIAYLSTNISYQNTSVGSNTANASTYSSLSNISFFISEQSNFIRIQIAVIYARYYRCINSIYTNSHACCDQTGTAGTGSKFCLQLIISFNLNILRRLAFADSAVFHSSIDCIIHIVDSDNTAYPCADSSRNGSISSFTQNIRIILRRNSNVSSIITVMPNFTVAQHSLSFAAIIENCNRSANSSTAHSTCQHIRITKQLNLIDMVSINSQAIVRAGNIFHLRCRLRRSLEHRGSACSTNTCIGAACYRNTNGVRQNIMLIERINRQRIGINRIFRRATASKLCSYVTVHNVAVARFTYSNTCISRSCYSRRADMAVNFRIVVCTHIYISSIGNIAGNGFIDIGCLNTSHSCALNAVHSHSAGGCHSRSRGYSHATSNNHVVNFVSAIRIYYEAS